MREYGKKNVDINDLISRQIAKAYNIDMNAEDFGDRIAKLMEDSKIYDAAYEEVIADAMQPMFTDANLAEKLAKLKAQDESLWQKIKSFFADLYKRIQKVYAGLDPDTP